jgi:hypothetical protein
MSRREKNIIVYIKVIEYEGVGWIHLTNHRVTHGLLKKIITFQIPSEAGNISYETVKFSRTLFLKVNFSCYTYFVLRDPNL